MRSGLPGCSIHGRFEPGAILSFFKKTADDPERSLKCRQVEILVKPRNFEPVFSFLFSDRVRENEAGLKPAADRRGAKRKVLFTMRVPAGMRGGPEC